MFPVWGKDFFGCTPYKGVKQPFSLRLTNYRVITFVPIHQIKQQNRHY